MRMMTKTSTNATSTSLSLFFRGQFCFKYTALLCNDKQAASVHGRGHQRLAELMKRVDFCRPAKVNEGRPHPDEIVESALLAHVSPPDITYKHHLQVGCCALRGPVKHIVLHCTAL